jgi:hypothetical protein
MATDTQYGMNACTKYEAILEDYLEGALDADESIAAEKHWRDCAGCCGSRGPPPDLARRSRAP